MSVQYTGECSVHWGFYTNSVVFPMTFPTFIMISPSVLIISPSVLNTPLRTHDILHCTHDILRCTEHPPLYCTDIMHGEDEEKIIEHPIPFSFIITRSDADNYWWFAYDVIENMIMQIMINLPQSLIWPVRPNRCLCTKLSYLNQ